MAILVKYRAVLICGDRGQFINTFRGVVKLAPADESERAVNYFWIIGKFPFVVRCTSLGSLPPLARSTSQSLRDLATYSIFNLSRRRTPTRQRGSRTSQLRLIVHAIARPCPPPARLDKSHPRRPLKRFPYPIREKLPAKLSGSDEAAITRVTPSSPFALSLPLFPYNVAFDRIRGGRTLTVKKPPRSKVAVDPRLASVQQRDGDFFNCSR